MKTIMQDNKSEKKIVLLILQETVSTWTNMLFLPEKYNNIVSLIIA